MSSAFLIDSGEYKLPEPNTGILATVFPTNTNWHTLYDHSYSEITNNFISIEGSANDDSTKKNLKKRVEQIVKKSYKVRYKSRLILSSLIFIIIIIIIAYSGMNSVKGVGVMSFGVRMFMYFIVGMSAISVIGSGFMLNQSDKTGSVYWNDYFTDLSSKIGQEHTLESISKIYNDNEQRDKDRKTKLEASRGRNNNRSGSSSFLGALAGSLISSKLP